MKKIILLLILLLYNFCTGSNIEETYENKTGKCEYIVEIADSINKQDKLLKYLGYNRKNTNQNKQLNESQYAVIKYDSTYNEMYAQIMIKRQELYSFWFKYLIGGGASTLAMLIGVVIFAFLSSVMN